MLGYLSLEASYFRLCSSRWVTVGACLKGEWIKIQEQDHLHEGIRTNKMKLKLP